MNVSAWAIRQPVPAILLFVLLTAFGLLGFSRMGIQNMPDISFPAVVISAGLEGAAPAQLETEVARKIEASCLRSTAQSCPDHHRRRGRLDRGDVQGG